MTAAKAHRHSRTTGLDERTALLPRLADAYGANADRLALMATLELGRRLPRRV